MPVSTQPRCGENKSDLQTTFQEEMRTPLIKSAHRCPLAHLGLSLGGLGLLGLLLSGSGGGSLLLRLLLLGGLTLVTVRRGPESQVVAQKLHDQGAVTVALLGEGIELGNSIIEGLLGEVACAVGRVKDLVVEDREVQGETKADGVSGGEIGLGNVGGVLFG